MEGYQCYETLFENKSSRSPLKCKRSFESAVARAVAITSVSVAERRSVGVSRREAVQRI